jgi:tetratricopeptide (TPR) repeat protein
VQVLRARVHIAGGELNAAFGLLQKAHIVFESHRDRDGVIDVLREQGNIYRMQGRPEAAASVFQNMIGKVGSNPKRKIRNQVYALGGVVDSLLSAGHIDQVKEYGDRLWRLAYDSGDTRDIAQATYAVGLIHLAHRDMFWAERHFQTARALAATLGAARVQISCQNNLGEVLRHNGDLENAARAYQQTATLAESRNWKVKAAVARLNLALLGVLQDQTEVSRTEIDHAERLLKDHPHHWAWLFIGLLRALWAAQAEDERACRAWWAVANERGLERMRAPDLRVPLERLAAVTRRLQWDPIFDRAAKLANQLPCPEE